MMVEDLKKALTNAMRGEVSDDAATRKAASRDTSLFTRMPELVVYPKDAEDVSAVVKEMRRARIAGADVSLAARAAGTDMTGGPLTTGVVVSF
ncbi:MAG: FAD linked oxidase domain protein, partial [Parcubacteria group bacterium Gr01-1014_49]